MVRPGSATGFLESLGVELVRGDLTEPSDCAAAVSGASRGLPLGGEGGGLGLLARVPDRLPRRDGEPARAAIGAGVGRFVHISSTSAYGHPPDPGYPIDEAHPLGVGMWKPWDYYTLSKVECERILWRLAELEGLPLTVIRPSWLYGERDRTTAARLVGRLRRGKIPLIGRGDNPLSAIYAGNVADAAILAAGTPSASGEAYNVTDQGWISQREFLDLFVAACGAPAVRKRQPYGLVFAAAFGLEALGRLTGRRRPPLITRYATWLMGRSLSYSTMKARERLGWAPALGYPESIERTVRWYLGDREKAVVAGRR